MEKKKAHAAQEISAQAIADSDAASRAAAAAKAEADSARAEMEEQKAAAAAAQKAAAAEVAAAKVASEAAKEATAQATKQHEIAVAEVAKAADAQKRAEESQGAAASALAEAELQRTKSAVAVAKAIAEQEAAEAAEAEARELRRLAEQAKEAAVKERDEAYDAKSAMEAAAEALELERIQATLPHPPPRDGMLTVTVVGCSGLLASDYSVIGISSSDPYVKIALDKDKNGKHRWFQTTTKSQIVHPRYDETFNFLVRENTPREECILRFRVFDDDGIGSDEFLGQVDVDLADEFKMEWPTKVIEQRLPLSDPHNLAVKSAVERQRAQMAGTMIGDGSVHGHLFVRISFSMDTYTNGTYLGRNQWALMQSSPALTHEQKWPQVLLSSECRVQYRGQGKFEAVVLQLLEGGVLAFRPSQQAASVRFASVRESDTRPPKSGRKGEPHTLILRCAHPGTGGLQKFALSFTTEALAGQWRVVVV